MGTCALPVLEFIVIQFGDHAPRHLPVNTDAYWMEQTSAAWVDIQVIVPLPMLFNHRPGVNAAPPAQQQSK
jgi:hypothetical protein